MSSIAPVTRKVARVVLTTIKKIGHSKGVTLKKIHDYIRNEYPNTPSNIVKLNNTLVKALAFGAVDKKKNRYVLGSLVKHIIDGKGRKRAYVIRTRQLRRRKGSKVRTRKRTRKLKMKGRARKIRVRTYSRRMVKRR